MVIHENPTEYLPKLLEEGFFKTDESNLLLIKFRIFLILASKTDIDKKVECFIEVARGLSES